MDERRVARITCSDGNSGSGYYVANDVVLTAYHVVEPDIDQIKDLAVEYWRRMRENPKRHKGKKLLWASPEHDVALVKTSREVVKALRDPADQDQSSRRRLQNLLNEAYVVSSIPLDGQSLASLRDRWNAFLRNRPSSDAIPRALYLCLYLEACQDERLLTDLEDLQKKGVHLRVVKIDEASGNDQVIDIECWVENSWQRMRSIQNSDP